MGLLRSQKTKRRRPKKRVSRYSFEFVVGVLTAVLLGALIGAIASPHPLIGGTLGAVFGALLGVALPKVFFAVGDAIVTALF